MSFTNMHEQWLPFDEPGSAAVHISDDLKQLKKIDLHRHLLGSISPQQFLKISTTQNLPLPTRELEELEKLLTIPSPVDGLQPFFRPWRLLSKLLVRPSVVSALVLASLEEASKDNISYVELRATWGMTGREPFSCYDFLASAYEGISKGEELYGIRGRIVLGVTRHIFGRHTTWHRQRLWSEILDAARAFRDTVVVGFDLSGLEEGNSPRLFKEEFRQARSEGFPITVHCGETSDVNDIWDALTSLEPKRISHALSCLQDDELISHLRSHSIPVEVCPTTNWLTKTVADLSSHPVIEMLRKGILVTINTDNPAICRTTLSKEYAILKKLMDIRIEEIVELNTISNEMRFSHAKGPSSGVSRHVGKHQSTVLETPV